MLNLETKQTKTERIQDFFTILDNEVLARCDLCGLDFVLDDGFFQLENHVEKYHKEILI